MLRLLLLLAALTAGAAAPTSNAQSVCLPAVLAYDGNAYLAETIPTSVSVQQAESLGPGELDAPIGQEGDRCERERGGATVVALAGIEPLVAVGVAGRPGEALVLGGKCIGFTGTERWDCLRTPLQYEGRLYMAARYPSGTTQALEPGDGLGSGQLGDDEVEVVSIEGIEPGAAVALAGDPKTAYVTIGVCQYGRFGETVLEDNLRRCLEAPFWLYFDPPGGKPGETIAARTDRPLPAGMGSAEISLAQSRVNADIVPIDAPQTAVGAVTPAGDGGTLTFELPDLAEGRYEAVLACDSCGVTDKTTFPAGSLVILEGSTGTNWGVVIMVLIGAAFVVLLVGAIIVRRRGWGRGGAARPPENPAGPQQPIR